MLKFIEKSLFAMRGCFSRKATFEWFVAVVLGMMIRTDKLGVASIIRALDLEPRYEALDRFFRSGAWDLKELEEGWSEVVKENAPLLMVNGKTVMVADGVRAAKEGKRMPAVKRMHQESGDSSKPEYIMGHLYCGVGVLARAHGKTFCIPTACEIQDGAKEMMSWRHGDGERQGSHVVETIKLAYRRSGSIGDATLLLDRLYLTVPAVTTLDKLNAGGDRRMEIVTMAKGNAVAYEQAPERAAGARGRPRVKGRAVKLASLFKEHADRFKTVEAMLYGKTQKVKYLEADLLWGKGIYRMMRFVLVVFNGKETILACTDVTMSPLEIIELYGMRFSIEHTFRSMKQDVGAFTNRFWTSHMPKLRRYVKSGDPDRACSVKDDRQREKILEAFDALEGYAFFAAIATGMLQMISLRFSDEAGAMGIRYMRTPSRLALSEASVSDYLRKNIFRFLDIGNELAISQIILGKMRIIEGLQEELVAS